MKRELNGVLKRNLKDKVLDIVQQYDVSSHLECVMTVYDEYYTEKYQAYEGIVLHINCNTDLYWQLKYIIVYIDNNDDIQVCYQDHMLNITNTKKSNLLHIDDVIEKAMYIKADLGKLIRYSNKGDILEQLEYIKNQVERIYTFIDQNF